MKTQLQNPQFGVRLKKTLQKSTLAIKWGKTQKTINFGGKLSFILSFHCCYIYLHCTYLYNYYNYSLKFSKKFLFFEDTTERWDRGVKRDPKIG
jgi:hypothetical protein